MPQSLQTLLDHATRERDVAIAALVQAEDQARRMRQQWEQLLAYRADYDAKSPAQHGRATTMDQLRGHHAFTQRLDQALSQQQGLLTGADQQVVRRRQTLLERETRLASERPLQERRLHDQQRSDEAATQRAWRDSAHSRPPVAH